MLGGGPIQHTLLGQIASTVHLFGPKTAMGLPDHPDITAYLDEYTRVHCRDGAKKAAEATLKKSERMNIRISPNDLRRLKIKAMEEGMPYQTLVSSIIHKYLIGRLQEQREQKEF